MLILNTNFSHSEIKKLSVNATSKYPFGLIRGRMIFLISFIMPYIRHVTNKVDPSW